MLISRKSKVAVLVMVVLLVMAAAAGCGSSGNSSDKGGEQSAGTSEATGTVIVAGSTSVQPLADELSEAFMEKNQDVKISVQGGGSSAGIESAQKGTAQIGTSSRELKPEEKGYGLTENVIARDGIAVIVNASSQVRELSMDQIKKIFTGEIKDWSQVGGKKGSINVVVREEGSGTRGAFQEIVLGTDGKFVANAVVQNTTGAVKTAVANDTNAIGFISLGSVDSNVKAVKVDGIEPSEATVINGSYKISRPFLFLTKGAPNAATKAFIDFVLSAEGQKIVSEKYVKVK